MRPTSDRSIVSGLTASPDSSLGSLVRRLAVAGLLLTALTILLSIALAAQL